MRLKNPCFGVTSASKRGFFVLERNMEIVFIKSYAATKVMYAFIGAGLI